MPDAGDMWDTPLDITVKTEPHPKWDMTAGVPDKDAMRCDQCKKNAERLAIMASNSPYHGGSFCTRCIEDALMKLDATY